MFRQSPCLVLTRAVTRLVSYRGSVVRLLVAFLFLLIFGKKGKLY